MKIDMPLNKETKKYESGLKSLHDDVISAVDDFLTMRSKYRNTGGRSVYTAIGTMFKK